MTRTELLARLVSLGACAEARAWVETQPGNAAAIWRACRDPQWMFWLLEATHAPDGLSRHLAADFAEEASQYAGPDEELALAWGVDVARRRADGEDVDPEEIDAARAATWAATGDAAGDAAGAAARAATWAAAEDAAGDATWSAAWAAARAAQCDLVRARVSAREMGAMLRRAER
jgi:hypothetical protein